LTNAGRANVRYTFGREERQGPLVITNIKLTLVHQQTTTLIAPNKNESMFKFVCGVGGGVTSVFTRTDVDLSLRTRVI
jgi:hypothetical protein